MKRSFPGDTRPMKTLLQFVLFILFFSNVFVPVPAKGDDPTLELLDTDIDFEEIFADLPGTFNLATATVPGIASLPYFTVEDAQRVIAWRDSLGVRSALKSGMETIPGISPVQRAVLAQVLSREETYLRPGIRGSFKSGFIGSPGTEDVSGGKYYARFRGKTGRFVHFGLIGERDPFESRALDLYSAHLAIRSDSGRTGITLGDFRPSVGQCLVMSRYGRNYAAGTHVRSGQSSLVENTLFEESLYLRGMYTKVSRGPLTAQAWSSLTKRDASFDENGHATVLNTSGLHSGSAPRDNLIEQNSGAGLTYTARHGISLGVAGIVAGFSPDFKRRAEERYTFYPDGSRFTYLSLNGVITRNAAEFFFEHTVSGSEHATLAGAECRSGASRSCVLVRNYSEGYWAPHAGGYSSFGRTSNERGIYAAFETALPLRTRLLASMDIARTLSRSYTGDMPESRRRMNVTFRGRPGGNLTLTASVRTVRDSGGSGRWSGLLFLENPRPSVRYLPMWRTHAAWSAGDSGGGPYGELGFRAGYSGFTFDLSAGFYDIPSYNARYYRYEQDVPGRGLTMPVWGRGVTSVFILRWNLFSARWRYADTDHAGVDREYTLQSDVVF